MYDTFEVPVEILFYGLPYPTYWSTLRKYEADMEILFKGIDMGPRGGPMRTHMPNT